MTLEQMLLVFCGALAGGFVNGLTVFDTGITAMGLWRHAVSPAVAASLVVVCSLVAQMQNVGLVWRSIDWRRTLAFVVPGLAGVPLGTWLVPHSGADAFKAGVGAFLLVFPGWVLARPAETRGTDAGGRAADAIVGFGGGVLCGFAGISGVLNVIWTGLRRWSKAERRSVIQTFNLTILVMALASHGAAGLLTRDVGIATLAALPGTIGGAWAGALVYRRLGDAGYQRAVMVLLLDAGVGLVWSALA